ncbi:MAPEG family protein [Gammaproteobacteria bacterium]|nr:MAPEG family protein [Gammaproteobacteria bacterium]
MTTYIICALLLALLQTWLIPAAFNMKNFPWLGSNRDESMPHEPSVMAGRAMRANTNLQETLPIFLALALLSMMQPEVDVTGLACLWLAFRVGHLVTYIAGFARLRTLLWLGSIVSLVMMALELI